MLTMITLSAAEETGRGLSLMGNLVTNLLTIRVHFSPLYLPNTAIPSTPTEFLVVLLITSPSAAFLNPDA